MRLLDGFGLSIVLFLIINGSPMEAVRVQSVSLIVVKQSIGVSIVTIGIMAIRMGQHGKSVMIVRYKMYLKLGISSVHITKGILILPKGG